MPRFDFECIKCGKVRPDVILARYNSPTGHVVCLCGGEMRKMPAAPNFKLVGKGFHCNDYGRKQ